MTKGRRILIVAMAVAALLAITVTVVRLLQDTDSIRYGHTPVLDKPLNKYPIIVHHGIFPFFSLHRFARDLREQGYNAYSTQVIGAASIADRSRELALQVNAVLAVSGAAKVHILAHSMGGLDARFIARQEQFRDKIASITTVSSPHQGACLAQFVDDLFISPLVYPIANVITGSLMIGSTPWTVDTEAAARDLRPDLAVKLPLISEGELAIPMTSYVGLAGSLSSDIQDPTLGLTIPIIEECRGANDGIVSQASARWGEMLEEIHADHFALIGRPRPIGQPSRFDAYAFHRKVAAELVLSE